jgi:hypothetical protein
LFDVCLVDGLRHRQIFNIHCPRVKRGFLKKPIRAAAAKEAGQGMSTEVNGCAPGSKWLLVRQKAVWFRGGQVNFLRLFRAMVKASLILITLWDLNAHGLTKLSGNSCQPVGLALNFRLPFHSRRCQSVQMFF